MIGKYSASLCFKVIRSCTPETEMLLPTSNWPLGCKYFLVTELRLVKINRAYLPNTVNWIGYNTKSPEYQVIKLMSHADCRQWFETVCLYSSMHWISAQSINASVHYAIWSAVNYTNERINWSRGRNVSVINHWMDMHALTSELPLPPTAASKSHWLINPFSAWTKNFSTC